MKIVILDGYATNPGDLSWEGLKKMGTLTVYDRTPPELILERSAAAEVLITNKAGLTEKEMSALPELRYIGIQATGVNVVALDAARKHGIAVTNVPAYSTDSVAQHVFALILELARGVGRHAELVKAGAWTNCPDFAFQETPQIELKDKTIGIVGFGDIGKATARIATAFGMHVLVYTRTPVPGAFPSLRFVQLDQLLSASDVVSLSCPLTPETEFLINAERLELMKNSAFLINTGRGLLVDEQALAESLINGDIAGAGLDVLSQEPPPADNPLLNAPNCYVTPHLAWATRAARQRLIDEIIENLRAFLDGESRNRVD